VAKSRIDDCPDAAFAARLVGRRVRLTVPKGDDPLLSVRSGSKSPALGALLTDPLVVFGPEDRTGSTSRI
jgi:hypothetical protein